MFISGFDSLWIGLGVEFFHDHQMLVGLPKGKGRVRRDLSAPWVTLDIAPNSQFIPIMWSVWWMNSDGAVGDARHDITIQAEGYLFKKTSSPLQSYPHFLRSLPTPQGGRSCD